MLYSARLKFQTECGNSSCDVQPEDCIHLISASNEEEARSKANALGESEQHEFPSAGGTGRWRFIAVSEIRELWESEFADGMEVYSFLPDGG
jgi:Domain of unknown function (DUF4288)